MKKTQKRIIGLLGLVIVAAMTIFAAFLPGPEASAISTVTDTLTVVVTNPEEPPSATIDYPGSGDRFLTPEQDIKVSYTNLKHYKLVLVYTDENGVEHAPETIAENDAPSAVGLDSIPFRSVAERYGYGKYLLKLEATGTDDSPASDTIEFEYIAIEAGVSKNDETGTTYVDMDFNQDQDGLTEELRIDKVVITVYDKDGNPVEAMPPIVVQPPVERVEIPFEKYGIPEGEYILVAQPFNSAGAALFDTVTMRVQYDGEGEIIVPSTADTGGLFKNLNIARADYLATGVGLFLVVGISSILFVRKHGTNGKRRK